MTIWRVAALSAFVALGTAAADENTNDAELGGHVYEVRLPNPAPPDAPMTLELRRGDDVVAKVQPNPDGSFLLRAEPGVYGLHVFAQGKPVAALNVALRAESEELSLVVPTEPIAPEQSELGVGGAGNEGK